MAIVERVTVFFSASGTFACCHKKIEFPFEPNCTKMIIDDQGIFGWKGLSRIHGSAVYKTVLPALLSTSVLVVYNIHRQSAANKVVQDPLTIGALISFFSFSLTFRLNYAYQRYWESATAVHVMVSKWLDAALNLAAIHYQSVPYDKMRPQALGRMKATDFWAKKRHYHSPSMEDAMSFVHALGKKDKDESTGRVWWKHDRGESGTKRRKARSSLATQFLSNESKYQRVKSINAKSNPGRQTQRSRIPIPLRFQEQFTQAGTPQPAGSTNKSDHSSLFYQSLDFERISRVPIPSLFMQEMAHLFSLMLAIALSTLRNDAEYAESPIVEYTPGKPWPPMDANDSTDRMHSRDFHIGEAISRAAMFCLGLERSPRYRTLYNAERPFAVLGGVSDNEVYQLQQARGPCAKVALASLWLQEFISREYLAGSGGRVAAPVVSGIHRSINDGLKGYHDARRIAYIPFPFPHGQLTSFFTLIVCFLFPVLFSDYVNISWFSYCLNFLTVLCFLGLHEVARELEQPFQNTPNDLPLCSYQAQFNEALVTVYAGFHPDSWWDDQTHGPSNQTTMK